MTVLTANEIALLQQDGTFMTYTISGLVASMVI
jgi:hypothetical protein